MKVTKDDLANAVALLNQVAGTPGLFDVCYAYGGVRLISYSGAKDVSPRGTKREVLGHINTAIEIITTAKLVNR